MRKFSTPILAALFLVASLPAWAQILGPNPFITRWEVKGASSISLGVTGSFAYQLLRADNQTIVSQGVYNLAPGTPLQIPIPDDGEYLLKMGPEGLDAFTMKTHSSSALRALVQWGDVQWKELSAAFYQCKQFTIEDNAGAPNLTQVDDLSEMFYGCTEFNQSINHWSVGKIKFMRALFEGCTAFNQSLESWDLRHLQSMSRMFYGCINFNGSVQGWNVSNVQYMDRMLEGCIAFDQTLASWTPSSIKGEIGLKQCGMSVENYSITLIEWASMIAQLPKNVTVDAQGLVYASKAADARNALVAKLWSFNGDVLEGTPVLFRGSPSCPSSWR